MKLYPQQHPHHHLTSGILDLRSSSAMMCCKEDFYKDESVFPGIISVLVCAQNFDSFFPPSLVSLPLLGSEECGAYVSESGTGSLITTALPPALLSLSLSSSFLQLRHLLLSPPLLDLVRSPYFSPVSCCYVYKHCRDWSRGEDKRRGSDSESKKTPKGEEKL